MIRSVTRWCVLGVTACVFAVSPSAAQEPRRAATDGLLALDAERVLPLARAVPPAVPGTVPATALGSADTAVRGAAIHGELHGTVRDSQGRALTGAVVSAHGSTAAFAMSDREGRFAFRSLPPGAYLIRVHLDGYAPPRGRYVQVNAGRRERWEVSLGRLGSAAAPLRLTAAVAGTTGESEVLPVESEDAEADDEVVWRLRNLKRGVLKEADLGLVDGSGAGVVRTPVRMASALFDDLTLNGQINFLTRTSFDRPQDLFAMQGETPRPIAYVSVVAPTLRGDWAVRGSMTQGDVSSWILAGSFTRRGPAPHVYEIGASYATQRYQGGNVEALAAVADQSRQAGELYAYDSWALTSQLTVGAGGRYATYGYLTDRALLSGRMSVAFQPSSADPLRVSVSTSHREIAPGAEEFVAPSTGLWLPPDRTFSELARGPFTPERVNQIEVAGEREFAGRFIVGVRAFRQEIDDQLLAVFGVVGPDSSEALGHYQVGTAGDFDSHGWGFSVTRDMGGDTDASVAYTQVDVDPHALDPGAESLLLRVAPSLVRAQEERLHDVTASLRSRIAATATRVYLVYKLNNAYAAAETETPLTAARFELQINQEIPFLDFTGASWEMLVGVRNLFRTDLYDGSVYDELLVVRPPKRVMGGVTVKF